MWAFFGSVGWAKLTPLYNIYIQGISFFFTNFSANFGEYEMWKIFRRWGMVKEVFISRKLNREGHKFGFVRFLKVKNVKALEK